MDVIIREYKDSMIVNAGDIVVMEDIPFLVINSEERYWMKSLVDGITGAFHSCECKCPSDLTDAFREYEGNIEILRKEEYKLVLRRK